ncbi:MAG: GNAT family N-acetyltransferase [Asgard group archaeon]|nr:GNAT family N-acetyltransferase [Asgard group archaeon]
MISIKEQEKTSMDREELVRLHIDQRIKSLGRELTDEETDRVSRYIDYLLNSFITRNFLAYENEELVGWLGVMNVKSVTILIWEDHPIIFSDSNKELIALELIQSCIKCANMKNVENVRIFTIESEERRPRYQELKQYFLQAGMKQTHTVLCMKNQLTPDIIRDVSINYDYHVESMNLQDRQLLMDCYMEIFAESYDNFTNSLDSKEYKVWNFTLDAKMTEDSRVIKKDKEIIAISRVVDYGDFMELGPIGVLPDHRGKGLGNVLMEECLASLLEQDKTNTYLEVDISNTPAIKLYDKYGFKEVSKKHGFLWRATEYKE